MRVSETGLKLLEAVLEEMSEDLRAYASQEDALSWKLERMQRQIDKLYEGYQHIRAGAMHISEEGKAA